MKKKEKFSTLLASVQNGQKVILFRFTAFFRGRCSIATHYFCHLNITFKGFFKRCLFRYFSDHRYMDIIYILILFTVLQKYDNALMSIYIYIRYLNYTTVQIGYLRVSKVTHKNTTVRQMHLIMKCFFYDYFSDSSRKWDEHVYDKSIK